MLLNILSFIILLLSESRSNSPVIADACTSKAKRSRRGTLKLSEIHQDFTESSSIFVVLTSFSLLEDPLSPSPSPGDTPADASHPESSAISTGVSI